MGSNWEWQCISPGARLSHSAPSLQTGALASVHRAEHLSSLQPLWWWPALPVRHTEFTSREMKQQGQSFLVTKLSLHERALGWESRAHKFWSSSQLCSTQTSWGCFLSPPYFFFQGCSQPAEKLLEGRVRLCILICTFHLPPGGTESNNQLPKTEAFPSEKLDTAKLQGKDSYLLFLTPLSCLHHFISVETKD